MQGVLTLTLTLTLTPTLTLTLTTLTPTLTLPLTPTLTVCKACAKQCRGRKAYAVYDAARQAGLIANFGSFGLAPLTLACVSDGLLAEAVSVRAVRVRVKGPDDSGLG